MTMIISLILLAACVAYLLGLGVWMIVPEDTRIKPPTRSHASEIAKINRESTTKIMSAVDSHIDDQIAYETRKRAVFDRMTQMKNEKR